MLYDLEKKEYDYCPYFDMGLSLFADVKQDFPVEKSLDACKKDIIAKPFSRSFDEQLDAANELYGSYLHFTMSKADMVKEVDKWNFPYEKTVVDRVKTLIRGQADKYGYMLK